jgi:hypothetical protein
MYLEGKKELCCEICENTIGFNKLIPDVILSYYDKAYSDLQDIRIVSTIFFHISSIY